MSAVANGGLLPRFDRRFFTSDETFTLVGSGGIGGKGLGLAFVRDSVLPELPAREFAGLEVVLPRLTVIGTDVFDAFLARNPELQDALATPQSDERIAHAFQLGSLPTEVLGDLRALVEQAHVPLAVRSSSLLEDALAHPFAGVYCTKMIPNNQADADTRFQKLVEAIKLVYASVFFSGARAYREYVGAGAEKMAVVVQEVVGRRHGDRFYPDVSGVARSYDYYAAGGGAEAGRVSLALGLGKTIVDGLPSWTYSPLRPAAPPPFGSCRELVQNTQTRFFCIDMGPPPPYDPVHEAEYLARPWVGEARPDGTLELVASSYDPDSDRLAPGLQPQRAVVINFAPLLSGGTLPLNECLTRLLHTGRQATGQEVEIEFALVRGEAAGAPARLGVLQLRPMARQGGEVSLSEASLEEPGIIVRSRSCLGDGRLHGLEDVVFLKPEAFDARHTRQIAQELALINRDLVAQGRRYLLLGFGRWGSSESWLGVPVAWEQISGAAAIVEAALGEASPDMSQGSHFFHNLISFGVLYLSVTADDAARIDWAWLNRQVPARENAFVKHVRSHPALRVEVDGRSRRGVVARGG